MWGKAGWNICSEGTEKKPAPLWLRPPVASMPLATPTLERPRPPAPPSPPAPAKPAPPPPLDPPDPPRHCAKADDEERAATRAMANATRLGRLIQGQTA